MSPGTVRKSESSDTGIERDVPTTAYLAPWSAATSAAPMPREAPVTMAILVGVVTVIPPDTSRR